MTRLALLLLSCSVHVPSATDPCARVEIAIVSAGPDCVRLENAADALFKLTNSESCGGPETLCLQPGQSAYVLERVRPSEGAKWRETRGSCWEIGC
jgi:hypothetical protein